MAYAQPGPPVVSGQFQLFADALALGTAKAVKIPLAKIQPTEVQAAGNAHKTKYPSGVAEFDDLEVTLFHAADRSAIEWLLVWQSECVNLQSTGSAGTGTTPAAAKRNLNVQEYDGANNLVMEWRCVGCFPKEMGSLDHESGKADAVELSLKFSVDRVERV